MTELPKTDFDTTIEELREQVKQFSLDRQWSRYHTPKNLTMSISIEAAELMEQFQWFSSEQSLDVIREPGVLNAVSEELADVLIYCLILADSAEIDVSSAVRAKIKHNEMKYPIGFMPTDDV